MPIRDYKSAQSKQPLEHCSIVLANKWWSQAHSFEDAIGYSQASAEARLAWDAIAEKQHPEWSPAFCEELELTISIWRRRYQLAPGCNLLNHLCATAESHSLPIPHFALLAIFRLRCTLLRP